MAAFFFVLVVVSGGSLKPGAEIVSSKSYFSEQSCAENARLIAQSMFIQDGTRYGFRCVKVDYEPPNLTIEPALPHPVIPQSFGNP